MQPQRGVARELRERLRAVLREADELVEQIQQAEQVGRHAARADRPRLMLIRGGKAVLVAPFVWLGATLRDHGAQAAGIAAAGAVTVATPLAAAPVIYPGAPPVSTTARTVETDTDPRPTPRPSRDTPTPTPTPAPTPADAEVVEPQATPPESAAPASALTPSPTPSPLSEKIENATEPVVERVAWTTATALAECRDVLAAPPAELRECVIGLLAG